MTPGPSLAAARPSSTRPAWSVLMVCTGNICRSPTAHGMLRHSMQPAGLHDVVHVDSAGTPVFHVGHPPHTRSIDTAPRTAVSIDEHRGLYGKDGNNRIYLCWTPH